MEPSSNDPNPTLGGSIFWGSVKEPGIVYYLNLNPLNPIGSRVRMNNGFFW